MTEETPSFLVPNDVYLKAGVHIGTKFKTKYMENFIYKTRPDGLSVMNVQRIDERLQLMANLLSHYSPEDILVVSRRENGWKPLKTLNQATGIRVIAGRYPPGILTNPALEEYTEVKIMVITDPWPDRNALNDAVKSGVVVIGLCDTNNQSNGMDLVVPCNNKGKKSLGLIYWIVAREYTKNRGLLKEGESFQYAPEDFAEED